MTILQSMKLRLTDLWVTYCREWRAILADKGVMLFFFVVPFIYPFLYSALYGNEGVRESPLVVVDKSSSALSREFVRRVDASPDVAVVAHVSTESEAYSLVASEKAYGILVIPEDFSKDLEQGRQAQVNLHTTFAAALYYKAYSLATAEVALTMGREIEARRHPNVSTEATQIAVRPIESEWITPYNPQSGFQGFLLPGILVLILQQTLLLGVSMLRGTEWEKGARHFYYPRVGGHYVSLMRLFLGRALCYLTIYGVVSCFVLVLAPQIFGLPQLTDLVSYLALLLPLLLSMTFFACFWGLFARSRETSMLVWVWTSIPFLFLTGLSWPLSAIPAPLKALGYLIPSTPGVQAFVAINSMGASLHEILPQYLTLWIQALAYLALCVIYQRYLLRKTELPAK